MSGIKSAGASSSRSASFVLQQGDSDKFWNIAQQGVEVVVHYGRRGSTGQTQRKRFANEVAARAFCVSAIAAKAAKGYTKQAPPDSRPQSAQNPAVNTRVTHQLALAPEDWFWASWRRLKPLKRPAGPPFDLAASLAAIRGVRAGFRRMSAQKLPIPNRIMSADENRFWLEASLIAPDFKLPLPLCEALEHNWRTRLNRQRLRDGYEKNKRWLPWRVVAAVLPAAHVIALLLELDPLDYEDEIPRIVLRHVIPYCTLTERARLQRKLSAAANLAEIPEWPHRFEPSLASRLAVVAGCHEVCKKVWQYLHLTGQVKRALPFVLGLATRQEVVAAWELWREAMSDWEKHLADVAVGWLAHTEFTRLDVLRDALLSREQTKAGARAVAEALSLVESPEAAPIFLAAHTAGKAKDIAGRWLETQAANTVEGLTPIAHGKSRLAPAARAYLRKHSNHSV